MKTLRILPFTTLITVLTFCIGIGLSASPAFAGPRAEQAPKPTLGWEEKIRIFPGDLLLHAKLSPASDHSSMHATGVEEFSRNGKKWVRFEVVDRRGKKSVLERPVVRIAGVKQLKGKPSKRYVVPMGICLQDRYLETELSLVDRSKYNQEVVLGRGYLAGSVLIDPSHCFLSSPKCSDVPQQ